MKGCSAPSGWIETSPSISRSSSFSSFMNCCGALAGLLERLVELRGCPWSTSLGWPSVEQRLALVERADRVGGRVEAQRQLLRVGAQPGEHERIAADIGGDVEVVLGQLALVVDEDVDALVQAHQRERDRVVADREDDRHVALDQREFVDRQRDRMLADQERRAILAGASGNRRGPRSKAARGRCRTAEAAARWP